MISNIDSTNLDSYKAGFRKTIPPQVVISKPGNHALFGDTDVLGNIQSEGVNVVACPLPISEAASAYIAALDLREEGDLIGRARQVEPSLRNFNAWILASQQFEDDNKLCAETIHSALHLLPDLPGKMAVAETIAMATQLYAAQTRDRGALQLKLKAKYPIASGTWHSDNLVDKRGFVTLNVEGSGTYGRTDPSITDYLRLQDNDYSNDFGEFGRDHMSSVFLVPSRYLAIWKGGLHEKPFIHAEVTSVYSTAPRLVLTLDRSLTLRPAE